MLLLSLLRNEQIANVEFILLFLESLLAGFVHLVIFGVFGSYLEFFLLAFFLVLEHAAKLLNLLVFEGGEGLAIEDFYFACGHGLLEFFGALSSFLDLLDGTLLFGLEHAHPVL